MLPLVWVPSDPWTWLGVFLLAFALVTLALGIIIVGWLLQLALARLFGWGRRQWPWMRE